jgi:hypothetical protein
MPPSLAAVPLVYAMPVQHPKHWNDEKSSGSIPSNNGHQGIPAGLEKSDNGKGAKSMDEKAVR